VLQLAGEIVTVSHKNRGYLGFNFFFSAREKLYTLIGKGLLQWDHYNKVYRARVGREGEAVKELLARGVYLRNASSLYRSASFRFSGSLRDYQEEAVKAWEKKWKRGVVALPTGSGKTVVGVAGISKINKPVLVIAFTVEQVRQWNEHCRKFLGVEALEMHSKQSRQPSWDEIDRADIVITTYHTAIRRPDVVASRRALIIDEVHHLPADVFKRIVEISPYEYVLGLSATPEREDGKHKELFPLIGGVVYSRSADELAEKGYLASFEIERIPVRLTLDEKRRYWDLIERYRELKGDRDFEELIDDAKRGDESAAEALRIKSEARMIALASESKIRKIREIVDRHIDDKIIIFAEYVDQARKIAEALNADLITGDTPAKKRKEIFERFRSSPSGVLVITRVGDEGIDIPDASVGIIASGTGSKRQYIQRIGRLLRPKPGMRAIIYEIYTADTTEKFDIERRSEAIQDESSKQHRARTLFSYMRDS
jgi:superfamily II DNA or RNA helicase